MLLCIDFQPAYIEAFGDLVVPLRERLREAALRDEAVHFIYNDVFSLEGEELGDSLARVQEWGLQESLELERARLIQKNFGWVSHLFRTGLERKVAITTPGSGTGTISPKPFWKPFPRNWLEMLLPA